jgi:hypothetical protein
VCVYAGCAGFGASVRARQRARARERERERARERERERERRNGCRELTRINYTELKLLKRRRTKLTKEREQV